MLIELITPLMLATSPMIIAVEPLKYSHETQQAQSSDIQLAQYRPITASGTQTFGYDGRPSDSDND
jgi:hypothetical protein